MMNETTVVVGWGECDPAAIVFYPNYMRWFNEAADALMARLGLDWASTMVEHGTVGMPLVEVAAKFLYPSRYGDQLRIKSWVANVTRKTVTLRHDIDNGTHRAVEGAETRFWGVPHPEDKARLRAEPFPPAIFERLMAVRTNTQAASVS